jgi:hypothetical protein
MIQQILFIMGVALLSITLIDVLGSIISRKFNFNYSFFSVFSLATYVLTGFYLSFVTTSHWVLLLCGIIGLFDGTVGLKISSKLKANVENVNYDNMKNHKLIPIVSFTIASLFGAVGLYL